MYNIKFKNDLYKINSEKRKNIETGFENLNQFKILDKPSLVILSGSYNSSIAILSGDIANYVCLELDDSYQNDVLEIVTMPKEYLIKRLIVNCVNKDYRKWTCNDYFKMEYEEIGKSIVDLIEVTKKLPEIINTMDYDLYSLRKIKRFIYDYANNHADNEYFINTLIVIDISDFNNELKYNSKCIWFVKILQKISHKLYCPIILTCSNSKLCEKIRKYADFEVHECEDSTTNNVRDYIIYKDTEEIGKTKLYYNSKFRRFEDYIGKEN